MSEDNRPDPASIELRRGSHSDRALPGIPIIAALVAVVSVALLVIGYYVFTIESQRREINQDLQYLKGREANVAEARESRIVLDQLRIQVESERKNKEELEEDVASLRIQVESQLGRIKSQDNQLQILRSTYGKLDKQLRSSRSEASRLENQIGRDKITAAQAELSASNAQSNRDDLLGEVRILHADRLNLETKVASLGAQREALRRGAQVLEEDQSQIRQIRTDLNAVLERLTTGAENVDSSAKSVKAAATYLERTTDNELKGITRRFDQTTSTIEQDATDLRSAVLAIAREKTILSDSRTQAERTAQDLARDMETLSDAIRNSEKRLTDSTIEISKTAKSLPVADQNLTDRIQDFTNSLKELKSHTQESERELRKFSSRVDQAARDYETEVEKVTSRIRASASRLESAADAAVKFESARANTQGPVLNDVSLGPDSAVPHKESE